MCVILAGVALVVFAAPASAQDDRKFGVVVAYPASVGFQWQAARKIAIRFDADYNQTSNEGTSQFDLTRFLPPISITTTTKSRTAEFGVSLLFDVHQGDAFRVYVAPRFAVTLDHSSFETEFGGDPALLAAVTLPANRDSSSTSPGGGLAMGASHDLGDRFRVFGEAGFNYSSGTREGVIGDGITSSVFDVRGGVGAVIRF